MYVLMRVNDVTVYPIPSIIIIPSSSPEPTRAINRYECDTRLSRKYTRVISVHIIITDAKPVYPLLILYTHFV